MIPERLGQDGRPVAVTEVWTVGVVIDLSVEREACSHRSVGLIDLYIVTELTFEHHWGNLVLH